MVLQKNELFSGTIKENLRWGNENATDEEIKHACHLACADGFMEAMPKQYDTYIEQGVTMFQAVKNSGFVLPVHCLKIQRF